MESQSVALRDPWRLGPGPFILRGMPPTCVGEIELINESDEKIRVRTIAVVSHKDEAVSNHGFAELRVGVRLSPRGTTRARAFYWIDPYTPPGNYEVELTCGSQHVPVVVHVWEKVALTINPNVINLRGGAGDVLTTVVVVTNEGNISQTLGELAMAHLEERDWIGRSVVQVLRNQQKEGKEEGYQASLDRLVKELRTTLPQPARVTLRTNASELQPGESRVLNLQMTLPTELVKGRTYIGFAKFMSGELTFNVECNGAKNSTIRRSR